MAWVNTSGRVILDEDDREVCKRHAAMLRKRSRRGVIRLDTWTWHDSLMHAVALGLSQLERITEKEEAKQ